MLSIKKKVLMPAVTAVLALALQACSSGPSDTSHSEYTPVSNGFIKETVLTKTDSDEAKAVRSNMEKVLSNEYAELYLGKAYDIAVIDTRTGQVWYSNEDLQKEDSNIRTDSQKKYAYSQLLIDYYRDDDMQITLTSYPDCYDGGNKDQVTYEVKDNVLSVTYDFGYDMEKMVIFENLSNESYEAMVERAGQAIEEGIISRADWGRTDAFYNWVADGDYYALREDLGSSRLKTISETMNALGYTSEDVRAEKEKVNAESTQQYAPPSFQITLNYTLDKADLMVSVDMNDIYEPDVYHLGRVWVLPGFGANTTSDEGYMILSDGTLIHNTTTNAEEGVSVAFYGNDDTIERREESELLASVPFPVYGIKTGDTSVFAVVESGDSSGGVDLMRSPMYARHMIAPWFNYHTQSKIYVGESNTVTYEYSEEIMQQPYVVRYHFLYDTRSTYNGMADYYREYLLSSGSLVEAEEGSKWYEDVNVVGGISGTKNIMGVMIDAVLAASDYESVQNWVADTSIGEKLSINYEGLFNDGVDGMAPSKLNQVDSLGTKDVLKSVLLNASVYPVLSLQTTAKEGNGISEANDFARTIGKKYASLTTYSLATGKKAAMAKNHYLISPMAYEEVVSGLLKAYKEYNGELIVLKDVGTLLYSDFNAGGGSTREDSKYYLCDALKQLTDAGYTLKVEGVNAYALKYGTAFMNVLTESQLEKYADYEIPFVGLVLHGVVPYSVNPLNEASCYEEALLDMIEYGANPGWRLITGDMSVLDDAEYTCYYSASADAWTDEILALNERLQDFYTAVSKEVIEEHSVLSNGLVRVTYSNGYQAYINRTGKTLNDGDISVEGYSFYLCNKEGIEQ